MANRRMFSKEIVKMDHFAEMPPSARALYFELGMEADDDGFVSPRGIMRFYGHSEDDLKVLVAKQFVIPFESGVIVIRHWKENNFLRSDRYKETQYKDEKRLLTLDENNYYCLPTKENTTGIPVGIPKVDPGKDRIGKVSIGKSNNLEGEQSKDSYARFVVFFNEITGRKFGSTDKKARRQYEYLVGQKITRSQFEIAIRNAYSDPFHIKNSYKYLTPEFITRPDKFERYLNMEPQKLQGKIDIL